MGPPWGWAGQGPIFGNPGGSTPEQIVALKVCKLAYVKSKQLSGDGVKAEFSALKNFGKNIGEEDLDLKCDICSSLTKPI